MKNEHLWKAIILPTTSPCFSILGPALSLLSLMGKSALSMCSHLIVDKMEAQRMQAIPQQSHSMELGWQLSLACLGVLE